MRYQWMSYLLIVNIYLWTVWYQSLSYCNTLSNLVSLQILVDILGRMLCVRRGEAKRLSVDSEASATGHPSYWELAARSLDRLFFVIYGVVFIIFALVCATAWWSGIQYKGQLTQWKAQSIYPSFTFERYQFKISIASFGGLLVNVVQRAGFVSQPCVCF